jgi:hypothetical protein
VVDAAFNRLMSPQGFFWRPVDQEAQSLAGGAANALDSI